MTFFVVTFFAISAVSASAIVNDTVKVGLRYGSTAMFSANLENAAGEGYSFGYFDEQRTFVPVGTTSERAISMTAAGDIYMNADGTYCDCVEFIENNYKEESYDDFDPQTAFSMDNTINRLCFLRLIEALPQTFNELSKDAAKQINETFESLGEEDIERFKNINEVAKRYQKTIQEIINERKIKDGKMLQPKTKKRKNKLSSRLRKAMTRT